MQKARDRIPRKIRKYFTIFKKILKILTMPEGVVMNNGC
jgi:hypothetical protein